MGFVGSFLDDAYTLNAEQVLEPAAALLAELIGAPYTVDGAFCPDYTRQEREKALKTYMNADGSLKQIPAREKKKIIILREIMKRFEPGREYTEKEVNRILKETYAEDFPSIRRALIEYGFMDRTDDCSAYRAAGILPDGGTH